MKSMIVSLALASLGLVSIVVVMYSGHERPAVVEESEDQELRALLEARRDTLNEAVHLIERKVADGYASNADLAKATTPALAADLELAKSQEERIAIFEKMLDAQIVIEKGIEVQWQVGTANESTFLVARAGRVEAVINLHKAKKGKWPLSVPGVDGNSPLTEEQQDREHRRLLEARRDTLKKAVQLIGDEEANGGRPTDYMAKVGTTFLEAELQLARSPQERVETFQKMLEFATEAEDREDLKVEMGIGRPSERLLATAARMKAEMDLSREKNGGLPASGHSITETPAEVQRPDDEELPASPEARRDTLKQAALSIRTEVEVGTALPEVLARALLLVLEAELELAKSQDERIAVFEKMLESQTDLWLGVKRRHEVGKATRTERLIATAARMKTEIELYKAKKGK